MPGREMFGGGGMGGSRDCILITDQNCARLSKPSKYKQTGTSAITNQRLSRALQTQQKVWEVLIHKDALENEGLEDKVPVLGDKSTTG
jgi:hypothetical protein